MWARTAPRGTRHPQRAAAAVLSAGALAYYAGGAGDEITLRDNVAAWQRLAIRPRVLVGVGRREMHITLLGRQRPHPLIVAPMAFQRLVHDDGVWAVLECAHHRRGDVPRAGPHRYADDVAHCAARAATSASTSSRYSVCRRSTTGPRRPSPIVRPSTDRTGTTPAKVPVTNASRAE